MEVLFKQNNLDLIRLFAALEVATSHAISFMEVDLPVLSSILYFIPGVPIFFFISGFLISKSYKKSQNIKHYSVNRILRIYPALIVVTVFGIFTVYLTGYFSFADVTLSQFMAWFVGQITIFQFFNPDFMRGYGVGVLNGSLWTICVELQFYILTPILYSVLRRLKTSRQNTLLVFLILISSTVHFFYFDYGLDKSGSLLLKLLGVSFIPWFYMFLIGILFQQNFSSLHKVLNGKLLPILFLYISVAYFSSWNIGNNIHPILYVILSFLVFTLSYSNSSISGSLLRGNDISYGVYVYHMIYVNLFIYYGFEGSFDLVLYVLGLTIVSGVFSWLFLEKKCLKLKNRL